MLRRLPGAVAVAAGGLRRSLSTARPPWALIQRASVDESGVPSPGVSFRAGEPPSVASLTFPAHLVHPRRPGDHGFVSGQVAAASSDGLLLVRFCHARLDAHSHVHSLSSPMRNLSWAGTDMNPEVVRFVCNPLSGELYRLPDLDGTKRTSTHHHLGLLTQSDAGHGPPDRFAVAEMFTAGGREEEGRFVMRRFLSETGKWDKVAGLPSPLPAGRSMDIGNAVVAFGDRLWWIDESCGAISVDPLSDRPELRFVELPDVEGPVSVKTLGGYRRMGVSEGKMRYIEVSMEKPYVMSMFSLDDGGSSWTLDHEVAFAPIWDDALLCSAPLEKMLAIGAIDPLKANILYLACGDRTLGVDMVAKKITGISGLAVALPDAPLLPCVLPTWLASSQIPSADWSKTNTLKSLESRDTVKRETLRVEVELMK